MTISMAVLGAQLVFSLIIFSFLQKLSPYLSLGRWLLVGRLVRYLHPSEEELRRAAGTPSNYQGRGKGTYHVFITFKGLTEIAHFFPGTKGRSRYYIFLINERLVYTYFGRGAYISVLKKHNLSKNCLPPFDTNILKWLIWDCSNDVLLND